MPEATDQVVTVSKAEPNHVGHEVPGRCIDITEPMPAFGSEYVAEARAFHLRQAELIHGALIAALPGGTLSNLFALMAADRASIFRVLDPAAEGQMRVAALAIHRPCHTATQECERTHELTWPAECVGCGYQGCGDPVDYPCTTARALGVTA